MKFSTRALLAAVFGCACTLAAYKVAPAATLSVVLLAPLPGIGIAFTSRRLRTRWRLLGCAALPATLSFYLGLIGPLTALVLMPEEWGLARARPAIVATVNSMYPTKILDAFGETPSATLARYQVSWASLVIRDDALYETIGVDLD